MKYLNYKLALGIAMTMGNASVFAAGPVFTTDVEVQNFNPRILLNDISASNTTNGKMDWAICVDDFGCISNNGPKEAFFINNRADGATTGSRPLTIQSNARTDALRLNGNNVGMGTAAPAEELHIFSPKTLLTFNNGSPIFNPGNAAIRLEAENTMSAALNKTWDIGVNGASGTLAFTNRSLSGGDATPFFISDFASASSLIVAATSNVGMGTNTPTAKLDVVGDIKATFDGASDGGLQQLLVMSANNTNTANRSDAGFVLENAREGFSWAFRTDEDNQGFSASKQGTGSREFELRNPTNDSTNVELRLANGARNIAGQWLDASSRSLKKNIHDLNSDDAMQVLRELKTVKFQYKSDQNNTQMVGFIAEDVPELVATHSRKSLSSMKIVAVLAKALQVQDISLQETKADMQAKDEQVNSIRNELKAKDKKIADMEVKISKLIQMQEGLAKTIESRLSPFATVSYNTAIK